MYHKPLVCGKTTLRMAGFSQPSQRLKNSGETLKRFISTIFLLNLFNGFQG